MLSETLGFSRDQSLMKFLCFALAFCLRLYDLFMGVGCDFRVLG